ncbi:MAG: hypothetical protein MP439_05495 [Ferrimicrobium sp.]|jgi:hypothetical protein|nr:hypothetical protein [Ferrimicrobium sp.]
MSSSVELARFGPIGDCAGGSGNSILVDIGVALCMVSQINSVVNPDDGEFKPTSSSNIIGYLSCGLSAASVVFSVIGSLSTPPIRDGVAPSMA